MNTLAWGQEIGQGWSQVADLGLAFVLCAMIGIERELRQKSAGLRTHTLVGLGAALLMEVSKYGFGDILGENVTLDPSRVAAQIVSGIGFIGGGLIFVRRDAVRGLTTAAVVWMTAAIGMTAGAGLWLLAILGTAAHFAVVYGFPLLTRLVWRSRWTPTSMRIRYLEGRGVLRQVLAECTTQGFKVGSLDTTQAEQRAGGDEPRTVTVQLQLTGRGPLTGLAAEVAEVEGVLSVRTGREPVTD